MTGPKVAPASGIRSALISIDLFARQASCLCQQSAGWIKRPNGTPNTSYLIESWPPATGKLECTDQDSAESYFAHGARVASRIIKQIACSPLDHLAWQL